MQVYLFQAHSIGPFFSFFLFIKHCRSHISPRVLMHGVTSAPSSPAIVCEEQCKGRGRNGRTLKALKEQSRKPPFTVTFLSNCGKKSIVPPGNARCSNRKNDVLLPDIKIRLITTKQFLGWSSFILCICRA